MPPAMVETLLFPSLKQWFLAKEALANKAVVHSLPSELFQMYVFSAG